ncbi:NAD(P)-dependent oxidoreductase [Aldersonia sp. NBC_00410]|uniref:NAD-dependent epimerase/dehydratase family protein n=1 Tax=Aldersonia sp. NBC_00410 TaxID=2975954 RepID=UPI00224F08FD|nr:NAD(P)-dependent oxidoreductase [Aldersonia sp. NBC_00410]MCX5042352.1 NAD(P)-dependent oxidoreductase [Aldersonia sp. NBC_00410]
MNDAILITGAFGQVGKRCTEVLLSRGRTVIAMDLRTETTMAVAKAMAEAGHPGTLRVVHADLLDAAAIEDIAAKHRPSTIIHLAAMYSPPSYRNPALARKVNVEGTANLVRAARALPDPPLVAFASSAAVYGSRNPHRYPELITPQTPVNPIDQYGQDKVLAENVITDSGLPHAILRLGGVLSPDGAGNINSDYLLLMRASPGDNRLHCVDARDVGMAFANTVDRRETINGKVLLIAGNNSYMHTHRDVEDDMMEAIGIGRLGPRASLPGDPEDDGGWSFTGWFDTTQSQSLLDYQHHDWPQTIAWVAESQTPAARRVLRLVGPVLRLVLRSLLIAQRRRERRGRYADPWTLIANKYGPAILAIDSATEPR